LTVFICLYDVSDYEFDFNQDNTGGCMLLLQCWIWK